MDDILKDNVVLKKSVSFAFMIIDLYKKLSQQNEFVLSKQIMRSWISIWANIVEANSASSKKDFLNKMNISLKEANETKYWLYLISKSDFLKYNFDSLFLEIDSIISLLTKIVISCKKALWRDIQN